MPSTGYHLYLIGYNFPEKLQISYIQTYTSNRGYKGDVDNRLKTQ